MFRNAFPRTRSAAVVLVAVPALATTGWLPQAAAEPAPSRQMLVGGTGTMNTSVIDVTRDGALSRDGDPVSTGNGFSLVVSPDGKEVFVASLGGSISGYKLGTDGGLTPIESAKADIGMPVVGLALTPDGSRLFATVGGIGSGQLRSFDVGPSGALAPTGRPATSIPGGFSLSLPAITPDARNLYVVSAFTDEVFSFAIAPDASLTPVGEPIKTGSVPALPTVTPDGRFLYLTEEQSNRVRGFAIGSGGTLTPVPGATRETGGLPHGVSISADGKRLYLPEAGGGKLRGYRIGRDGSLTDLPGSPYAGPEGMPGLVRLSPDGRRLFVIDVLTAAVTSRVHTYNVAADGSLARSEHPSVDSGVFFSDGPNAVLTPNQGPVAAVRVAGVDGRTATFSAGASTDPDGTVARYRWRFGDGSAKTTTAPEVTHTYAVSGTRTVTVTVVDDEGCSIRLVYTGQSNMCGGGPAARATADVTVE